MRLIVAALLLVAVPLWAQVSRTSLCDPTNPTIVAKADLLAATTAVVDVQGGKALEVRFTPDSTYPHILFRAADGAYEQTDWSRYTALCITVSNPMDQPIRPSIRIDDAPEANGSVHCRQGGAEIPAGGTAVLTFNLAGSAEIEGMRGQPRRPGLDTPDTLWIRRSWPEIDFSHIVAFQLFLVKPQGDMTLRLHKVELLAVDAEGAKPFVDRYGQFTDEEWPGKLHNDGDFAERRAAEEEDLAEHPAPADRDRFGGWSKGPELEATGRFRVAKHDGTWWFVDPDGRLFWSSGITCVRAESGGPTAGRSQYFSWLPAKDDPLGAFYQPEGKTAWLDFGKMNLYRKFGADYQQASHELAVRRLRSWGFNTVGNWSASEVWRLGKVPYTIPVGYRCKRIPIWDRRSFPDVFSPEFEPAVRKGVAEKAEFKDDPWLLGVFIENELPWAGWGKDAYILPATILSAEEDSEIRNMMMRELKAKYANVADLNKAWGTAYGAWDALPGGEKLTKDQQETAKEDLSHFCTVIAQRYFEVCEKAMRDIMPGTLYLGPRLASYNREVVEVAAKHCDVVCFNIYNDLPDGRTADELAQELDFPIVIGEFHFGALDRGMFHTGLRGAKDQNERAEKFAAYVRTAASGKWCVGSHWFQYRDQPLTGRFDGENYNIGFVTITDTPYPEMRAAARALHKDLYSLRAAQ